MHRVDSSAIDLNLLKLLEALFETRNVTRAGDRLDLSQPAASRALQRLRRALGDPLFVRGGDGLVPTPHAERLHEPLVRALAAVRAVIAPHRFDPKTATGAVRLVAPDVDAATLVPKLLATFAREAPHLDIELPPRGRATLELLASDRADLALGVFDAAPAGFRRQRLYSDTMVCMVRKGHPVLRRGLTLDRFVDLRHALITITGEGGGAVDVALAAKGLARRVALRIPSFLAAPLVVARSDLIVTLPRRTAAEFAALAPLDLAAFDVSQLWHERQQAEPRHAWLRHVVQSVATNEEANAGGHATRSKITR